jgi:hypothetical protein
MHLSNKPVGICDGKAVPAMVQLKQLSVIFQRGLMKEIADG